MSERPRARTSRELMIDSLKVEVFDALLEKFQNITSKMKHISPGDEEIGQKLLREQAKKVQAQIVAYLENRTKYGLELTDEMIAFKGLETKLKELHFETVIKPQLPKPPKPEDIAKTKEKYSVRYKTPEEPPVQKGDGELASAMNLIKKLRKDKKALQLRKKKPETEMEMIELINRNLKKNGKCNNEKCGRELEVDGETIKRWIEEFGLSRYAYNPKHRK